MGTINFKQLEDTKITVDFQDGTTYHLESKEKLKDINERMKAIFVFDNGEIYKGVTNGELYDGDFCLQRTYQRGASLGIGLPFRRLIGWAYEKKKETPITKVEENFKELGRTQKVEFISRHIELATANAVAEYIKSYLFDVLKDIGNDEYVAEYLKIRGYNIIKI